MTCTRPWLYKLKDGSIIELPCGRCMSCRIQKKNEWKIRLENELEYWSESSFITLTYADEWLPQGGNLIKKDVQLFIKRLRDSIKPKRIKVFYCGEYGDENLRPHYHLILFGWKPELKDLYLHHVKNGKKRYCSKTLDKLWIFGINNVGVVEPDSIQYVCGYTTKKLFGDKAKEVYGDRTPPFLHCSKGLGLRYAIDNVDVIKRDLTIMRKGKAVGLPAYYKRKLDIDPGLIINKAKDREVARNNKHYAGMNEEQIHYLVEGDRIQREKNLDWKEKNK